MTLTPELAPSGDLLVAERTLAVLIAHAADPVHAAIQGDDAREQLTLLQAAGVIRGGESHPAVRTALAAIVRPDLCTLELVYAGARCRAGSPTMPRRSCCRRRAARSGGG
jgi:hypothetical protein